jgi:hypothetical protein
VDDAPDAEDHTIEDAVAVDRWARRGLTLLTPGNHEQISSSDRHPGGPATALGDYVDELATSFRQRLQLLDQEDPKRLPEAFQWNERDDLTEDERDEYSPAATLARRAIEAVIGPALWHRELGPLLDTSDVTQRLGITRQAVALRVCTTPCSAFPGAAAASTPCGSSAGPEVSGRSCR